jgi:hypothetical protein
VHHKFWKKDVFGSCCCSLQGRKAKAARKVSGAETKAVNMPVVVELHLWALFTEV